MVYRRKGTALIYNVTNPDLVPLYEGNEAYEVIEEKQPAKEETKATKKSK